MISDLLLQLSSFHWNDELEFGYPRSTKDLWDHGIIFINIAIALCQSNGKYLVLYREAVLYH